MSRRIRFTVKSADLQDVNSESKQSKTESSGPTVAFQKKKRNEDKNRENNTRDCDSRPESKSSISRKNANYSQKGTLTRRQSCEEIDCTSSLTHAEVRTISRASSKRDRGLGRKNGGNIESISPVRLRNTNLPVTKDQTITIIGPATVTFVGCSDKEKRDPSNSETLLKSIKRVSREEIIRILTRSTFNLIGLLIVTLTLVLFASHC